ITDDLSGFRGASFNFRPLGTGFGDGYWVNFGSQNRISGTETDGLYSDEIIIPRYATTGNFELAYSYVDDAAGNYTNYTAQQFVGLGFSSSFMVSGLSDVSGPQLLNLTIVPQSPWPTHGGGIATVSARVCDDQSGFVHGFGTLISPSGNESVAVYLGDGKRVSGNALDGTYVCHIQIPEYAESGIWHLQTLALKDGSGKTTIYDAGLLSKLGMNIGFMVQPNPGLDQYPPSLVSMEFVPPSLNVFGGVQPIQLLIGVEDDQSGFYIGTITFQSPRGIETSLTFGVAERSEGSSLNGIYKIAAEIPTFTTPGIWNVRSVVLTDRKGRSMEYTAPFNNPALMGHFMVIGPPDDEGPNLAGLQITPTQFIDGVAQVSFTGRCIDALSGFSSGTIEILGPHGQIYGLYLGQAQRVSGSSTDGIYANTLKLPATAAGLWQITRIDLSDEEGNATTLGFQDLGRAGLPNIFEVVGQLPPPVDLDPPELVSLQIQPAVVDLSGGPASIVLTASFSDNLSFIMGAYFTFISPSGHVSFSKWADHLDQIGGSPSQPIYRLTLEVPANLEGGLYRLATVEATDWAGNFFQADTYALELMGITPGIWVSILDITPPLLSLNGQSIIDVDQGQAFADPGALVKDNRDGARTVWSVDAVDINKPGAYLLAYDAKDERGNAAAPIQRTVRVWSTFAAWSGGASVSPTSVQKYIFGGASSPSSPSQQTMTTAGDGLFKLSLIVRTNSTHITVSGQTVSDLAAFTDPSKIQHVYGTPSTNQDGVPAGCQRQEFITPANDKNRAFLRVKGVLAP
ncbi:MAG: DUF5011 domain-containing protein, partial [Verrucomicrobia bacterium]|nr:DUF5011 domain-containing protein [Verrucomicrobiota bacterium]